MIYKTALYDEHVALGGKIVEFAGWELPVQYSGVIAEHDAVRHNVGVFDVSHMGEFKVSGENAEAQINALVTNDIRGMYDGQARYSLLPNESGGAVDDIIIYRENEKLFWIVVNAANTDKDFAWITSHAKMKDVVIKNVSNKVSQFAIQGPKAIDVLKKLVKSEDDIPQKNYSAKGPLSLKSGAFAYISRTGYTGEDGFELYIKNENAVKTFRDILEAGEEFGILPCGLGARDVLRLEAAMPLYGHELSDSIPIDEVGLGFAIKMFKDVDFIGKAALAKHIPEYERIGAFVEKGIAREGSEVYFNDIKVGYVTSGTHSPLLGKGICMIRIKKGYKDKDLEVDIRGRRSKLQVTALPFYKREK